MSLLISALDGPLCSHDSVTERVAEMLREAQENGWTDDILEAASGVKVRAIRSYRTEGKEPSLSHALSLISALGRKHGVNRVMSLIGYCGRPLDEADELHPGEVVAALMTNGGVIAKAAADGRFDHLEEPMCRAAADAIIETVLPLASAGKAA